MQILFCRNNHFSNSSKICIYSSNKLVTLNFKKERTGEVLTTKAKVGSNFYDVVIDNDIDLDGFGS